MPKALTKAYATARLANGRANVLPTHASRTVKDELRPPVMKKIERYLGAVVVVVAAMMKPMIPKIMGSV